MQVLNPLAFVLLAILVFVLAEPDGDTGIAGLWVVVLLATTLSLDTLFRRDFDNGMLEQLLVTADVPTLVILIRVLTQWMFTGLIVALLAPVLGYVMNIPGAQLGHVVVALVVGTPALNLIGSVGAALTVGLSRGGLVLALLVLPLFIPVLIFGVAASLFEGPIRDNPQIYWLLFFSMLALVIGPIAATAGLKLERAVTIAPLRNARMSRNDSLKVNSTDEHISDENISKNNRDRV